MSPLRGRSVFFLTRGGQVRDYQPGFQAVPVSALLRDRLYILLSHARVHDIQRALQRPCDFESAT